MVSSVVVAELVLCVLGQGADVVVGESVARLPVAPFAAEVAHEVRLAVEVYPPSTAPVGAVLDVGRDRFGHIVSP